MQVVLLLLVVMVLLLLLMVLLMVVLLLGLMAIIGANLRYLTWLSFNLYKCV